MKISLLLDLQFFIDLHQQFAAQEYQAKQQGHPIITSECPGWICYLEKVVKEPLVSLSSRIKTPQMLAGHFLKRFYALAGLPMQTTYIGSITPCHDKKLETFRKESQVGRRYADLRRGNQEP